MIPMKACAILRKIRQLAAVVFNEPNENAIVIRMYSKANTATSPITWNMVVCVHAHDFDDRIECSGKLLEDAILGLELDLRSRCKKAVERLDEIKALISGEPQ